MDVVTYKAIQQSNAQMQAGLQALQNNEFNPWNYTEHQAVNTAVNATSLTTLMSVTGKGMLEEAIILAASTVITTTALEIVITADGNVILDMAQSAIGTSYSFGFGIVPTADIHSNTIVSSGVYLHESISGLENLLGGAYFISISNQGVAAGTLSTLSNVATTNFPSATQQSFPLGRVAIIPIEQPIYFNRSLLVQIKGVASSGTIAALVKARY